MTMLAILFAATLSSGNAEFEKTAARGAFDIAVGREAARLVADGPAKGALAKAMLSKPEAFVKADAAKDAAWTVYQAMLDAEYATLRKAAGERLGVADEGDAKLCADAVAKAKGKFESRYAEERAAACAEQAASLVGIVRPSVEEFETKDEDVLKREMSEKVASQQKTPVFEENLGYISTKIVAPVIDAAKKERKRQGEYLRRARSDAYAPSALAKDLADKLALNVKDRKAKFDDIAFGWDIFPSVTNVTLRNTVHSRTMDRMAAKVAEVPIEVTRDDVAKTIAADRAKHRKEKESKDVFRRAWTGDLYRQSVDATQAEAPEAERNELNEYLVKNMSDDTVAKAVNKRVDEQLMPKLAEARRELTDAEFAATWPTLADRRWFPDADTADETSARSDFAAAVKAWRDLPRIELAKGEDALEESAARADKGVSAAFEIARGAVMAQTKIVDEVHPSVLKEAQEKKDGLLSAAPDFNAVVAMLTEAVEKRWAETKVGTLWPKGDAPANAEEQHAELFPSVKKRIEMVAKTIVAKINKQEEVAEDTEQTIAVDASREGGGETEKRVPGGEKKESSDNDDKKKEYAIKVSKNGERVTVTFCYGDTTLDKQSSEGKMDDFLQALRKIGEAYGKRALKLK